MKHLVMWGFLYTFWFSILGFIGWLIYSVSRWNKEQIDIKDRYMKR